MGDRLIPMDRDRAIVVLQEIARSEPGFWLECDDWLVETRISALIATLPVAAYPRIARARGHLIRFVEQQPDGPALVTGLRNPTLEVRRG